MGSSCSVSIAGFVFWGTKSQVDDATLSVFHERDRELRRMKRPAYGHGKPEDAVIYVVAAQDMRERLDALGYTVAHARADYLLGLKDECETYCGSGFAAERRRVRAWTYDRWSAAIARLLPLGFQVWSAKHFPKDRDAERIADDMRSGVGSFFSDPRFLTWGLLDALPEADEVVLDVTDLVGGGYYGDDEPICDEARRGWAHEHSLYGSILLLTEGRTDTRILRASLEAMAPHLAGLYGFQDFKGLRVEGSADTLPKTVRSFIGAGISQRVVAVFDNDTAGVAAMSTLSTVPLPGHFRVMTLPANELARDYPTLGPQGPGRMAVNGMACGIEMYLGTDALRDDAGELLPVRWTGYNTKLGRYQGAVQDKDGIATRFLQQLAARAGPMEAHARFPEVRRLIDAITAQFSEAGPRHRLPRENLSD